MRTFCFITSLPSCTHCADSFLKPSLPPQSLVDPLALRLALLLAPPLHRPRYLPLSIASSVFNYSQPLVDMLTRFITSVLVVASFLHLVSAHGVMVAVAGANGVTGQGFGADQSTPRDGSAPV